MSSRLVYLVRHGETEGESSIRYHGRNDVALSDVGRGQIRRLIPWLAELRLEAVVHSPLCRADESARILVEGLARRPTQMEGHQGLVEVNFGAIEGLTEAFSIDRVGSSGAQFDLDKLRWFNQQHLRLLSLDDLLGRIGPHLQAHGYDADEAYLRQVAALLHDRITLAEDLATLFPYFFEDPTTYDEKAVKKRWKDDSAALLAAYADRLEQTDPFTEETTEAALRALAEEHEAGAGRIIHPTRLAVSGTNVGPSLFGMLTVLGRETCVRRLRRAVEVLG